jgi:hypothetical protein
MPLLPLVVSLATDPTPADKDVIAGWTAFVVFLLLGAAVVFLSFSMRKQFRKVEAARKAGVYGEEAKDHPTPTEPPETNQTPTP